MKKKKKKSKKSIFKNQSKAKKKVKKTFKKLNKVKIKNKIIKRINIRRKKNNKRPKKSKKQIKIKSAKPKKQGFLLKLINFQNSLKPEFNFRFNFGFEKSIQAFFDKIADTISQYKILKKDEARRLKLEKQEKERL